LQYGFPLDVKDNHFNATPLDVALYTRNNSPDAAKRKRCDEVIALLARGTN